MNKLKTLCEQVLELPIEDDANKLARACLVLIEAIEHEASDIHSGYESRNGYSDCECRMHSALRNVEKIASDK